MIYNCPDCGAELQGSFGDDVSCTTCKKIYETDFDYVHGDPVGWITREKRIPFIGRASIRLMDTVDFDRATREGKFFRFKAHLTALGLQPGWVIYNQADIGIIQSLFRETKEGWEYEILSPKEWKYEQCLPGAKFNVRLDERASHEEKLFWYGNYETT